LTVKSTPEGAADLPRVSARERRKLLLSAVEDQGYCTTAELATRFGVSEMTIRRDVAGLVDKGLLRSFHGGVSALSSGEFRGSDYSARAGVAQTVKRAIAMRACEMIDDGAVVGLDAGSTVAELAELLAVRPIRAHAVTASLPVISALANAPLVEVMSLGGNLHSESQSFAGPATLAAIDELRLGTFFLGASAFSARGAFCANDFDSLTKRKLIEVADRVVLLADTTKTTRSAMAKVCDWDAIDVLVTDHAIDGALQHILDEHGVELVLADSSSN